MAEQGNGPNTEDQMEDIGGPGSASTGDTTAGDANPPTSDREEATGIEAQREEEHHGGLAIGRATGIGANLSSEGGAEQPTGDFGMGEQGDTGEIEGAGAGAGRTARIRAETGAGRGGAKKAAGRGAAKKGATKAAASSAGKGAGRAQSA